MTRNVDPRDANETAGGNAPPAALVIGQSLYQAMIDHVQAELPYEGCGLIAVEAGRAVKLYPGTNTARSQSRYNMDPREVGAALTEIEREGWQLGAIYHSHPHTPALPSATDLAHAYYPEALMVIISFSTRSPIVRAFRVDGEVQEVVVMVVPG